MSRPRDPSTTTTALVGPEIFSFLMQLLKAATSEKRLSSNLLGTLAGAMASCSLGKVLRGHMREKREVESEEKGKKKWKERGGSKGSCGKRKKLLVSREGKRRGRQKSPPPEMFTSDQGAVEETSDGGREKKEQSFRPPFPPPSAEKSYSRPSVAAAEG